MASLSDQTKLRITLGALATLLLASIGGAFTVGMKIAAYDARLNAIETRQDAEAKLTSSDITNLISENKETRDALVTTNNNVTRLSTQLEAFMQRSTSVRSTSSQSRVVVVSATPSQTQNQNPQPQPEPDNPLQPAPNVVQRLLADIRMLL